MNVPRFKQSVSSAATAAAEDSGCCLSLCGEQEPEGRLDAAIVGLQNMWTVTGEHSEGPQQLSSVVHSLFRVCTKCITHSDAMTPLTPPSSLQIHCLLSLRSHSINLHSPPLTER